MNVTTDSPKIQQYIFLVIFLGIFVKIIYSSIKSGKSESNINNPYKKSFKNCSIYEIIFAFLLVGSLPCGAISLVVFESVTASLVCSGIFILSILSIPIYNYFTKVVVINNKNGMKITFYYTQEEFESKLIDGTINLKNYKIKLPIRYKIPKYILEALPTTENNSNQDS